jgi:cell filamentation protein
VSGHDPYAYPGSNVLRNKAGLHDPVQLQGFEYRASAERAIELDLEPLPGAFDLRHLCAIHRHLFQDVYEWAGELRTVSIAKDTSVFALPERIEGAAMQVFADLAKDGHLVGLVKDRFVERLGHHFAEINALHPFREGNGRSARVFLQQLARGAGYELAYEKTDAVQWNDAARQSFHGELRPLKKLFDAVSALLPGSPPSIPTPIDTPPRG